MKRTWFCTERETGRLLYDYTLGLLTEAEELNFEAHLMGCDACHRKLARAMRFSTFVRKNPQVLFVDPETVLETAPSPLPLVRLLSWNRRLVLAGACLLLVLAPTVLIGYLSWAQQARYGLTLPGIDQVKNINEESPDFHSGVLAFQNKAFEKALRHFSSYLKQSPDNFDANFLAGLCYLELSKKGIAGATLALDRQAAFKGIAQLERANRIALDLQAKTGNNRYFADSVYYLGKAYYMLGDTRHTREYFQAYLKVEEPVLAHRDEVRRVLQILP